MTKWMVCLAFGLFAAAAHSQVALLTDGTASVTVVVNGKTYSGTLQASTSAPAATTQDASTGTSATAPRLSATLPVAPTPGTAALPALMMTAAWPLNQPALQYPDETRSLKSSYGDGQFTPKPIASTFAAVFGSNHVNFDTTMPWTVVDSDQTPGVFAPVTINHPEWGSDNGSTCHAMAAGATVSTHWPVKAGVIEGADNLTGDRHMLVMDTATSRLYELFGVSISNAGTAAASYSADAGRCWNTTQPSQGQLGQNSADAAGLPILPLLLRFDEASTGAIRHALRFTVNLTRANANGGVFTSPAAHAAGNNWSSMAYMGMRLRLRSDFDASPYSTINQAIVQSMKTYGIVIADNGITGLVTADNDSRWSADDLNMLGRQLTLADFVPVNSGAIIDSTGADAE